MTQLLHFLAAAALAGSAFAQSQPARSGAAEPQPPAKAIPAGLRLPAVAQQTGDGAWRAKDDAGKEWIYKKTPFGLIRVEAAQTGNAAPPAVPSLRVIEASGDTVRFERATPFGKAAWTREVPLLSPEEKSAFDAWQTAPGPARN